MTENANSWMVQYKKKTAGHKSPIFSMLNCMIRISHSFSVRNKYCVSFQQINIQGLLYTITEITIRTEVTNHLMNFRQFIEQPLNKTFSILSEFEAKKKTLE